MTHDYHGSDNYSPAQIWHDGCRECAARSESDDHGIAQLDVHRFRAAWSRAARWNTAGVGDVCGTEAPLLRALWSVQLQLERTCGLPVGELPIVDGVQRNVLTEHADAVAQKLLDSGHSAAFESLMRSVREARAARSWSVEQARAALLEWQDGGEYPA